MGTAGVRPAWGLRGVPYRGVLLVGVTCPPPPAVGLAAPRAAEEPPRSGAGRVWGPGGEAVAGDPPWPGTGPAPVLGAQVKRTCGAASRIKARGVPSVVLFFFFSYRREYLDPARLSEALGFALRSEGRRCAVARGPTCPCALLPAASWSRRPAEAPASAAPKRACPGTRRCLPEASSPRRGAGGAVGAHSPCALPGRVAPRGARGRQDQGGPAGTAPIAAGCWEKTNAMRY